MPDNVNGPAAQNADMASITPDVVTEGTPDVTPTLGSDEFGETFLQSMMTGDSDLAREVRSGLGVDPQASEPAQQPEQPHPQAVRTQHQPATPHEGTPADLDWNVDVIDPNTYNPDEADFFAQPATPPPAPPAPDEAPPPELGRKATNRFQQLITDRKAAEARADQLETRLAQVMELMARQTENQTKASERAMQLAERQEAEASRRRQLEQWQSEGMNPADFGHQVTVQGLQKATEATTAVQELRAEVEAMRQERVIAAYESDAAETTARVLSSYAVTPQQVAQFADQAVRLGIASGLRSREAVEQVLRTVAPFLPKKGAAPTPKPADTGLPAPVANGIAARASGTGRPSGPGAPAAAGVPAPGGRRTAAYDGNLSIMQNMARMPGFEALGSLDRS